MKTCIKCNIEKDELCFEKNRAQCNSCVSKRKKEYREKNKEKIKKKRRDYHSRPEVKAHIRELRLQKRVLKFKKPKIEKVKKEKIIISLEDRLQRSHKKCAEYYLKNKNKILEKRKNYYQQNKKIRRLYEYNRSKTDICYKLARNLRIRLYDALKRNYKSGSAVRDLGCSISDLKQWLEQQFQPGMTWENYGKEWNIDHIIPLSRIDLTDRKQLLKVCNWFNLRPMWVEENISKGNKIGEFYYGP